ncbi:MAG TPA: sigma 54-interacting transcriptional regulator [Vicinamibacterales bacterium]|nr:sigma 54-interacting transcriptional regulator [Vicinamibacterales bacterium]
MIETKWRNSDTSGFSPRVRSLVQELDRTSRGRGHIVGESPAWKEVLTCATQVAATEATVLLLGESGTGKEVVARFIQRASPREHGPFVAINCAALPDTLLESELFGYERGAFTGADHGKAGQIELASTGVLFLDEVSEMSPAAQAKFLRVLQEREFRRLGGTRVVKTNARVIAATNRDLRAAVDAGEFREDLYYRLRVFDIRIPPLRDRPDDIALLTDAFLQDLDQAVGRRPAGISDEVRLMLAAHDWPGNVRELRNVLERATILCGGGLITPKHVALPAAPRPPSTSGGLDEMVRRRIEQTLHETAWNIAKSARRLGLSRTQVYGRLKRYRLERPAKGPS